jgi:hypothetical protein
MSVAVGSVLRVSADEHPEGAARGESSLVQLVSLPNYPLYVDGKLESLMPNTLPDGEGVATFSSVLRAFEIGHVLVGGTKGAELTQERVLFEKPTHGRTFPYMQANLYRGTDRTQMLARFQLLRTVDQRGAQHVRENNDGTRAPCT